MECLIVKSRSPPQPGSDHSHAGETLEVDGVGVQGDQPMCLAVARPDHRIHGGHCDAFGRGRGCHVPQGLRNISVETEAIRTGSGSSHRFHQDHERRATAGPAVKTHDAAKYFREGRALKIESVECRSIQATTSGLGLGLATADTTLVSSNQLTGPGLGSRPDPLEIDLTGRDRLGEGGSGGSSSTQAVARCKEPVIVLGSDDNKKISCTTPTDTAVGPESAHR